MKQRKSKAFTLIELIAVLVIMAIIALIVTPLVMSIIRKAKVSADRRSIDAYGRSIELAIAGYLMDTGSFPTSIGELTVEYSGDEVVCSTTNLNADSSVYLAGCTVAGRNVEGYTYGSDKSSPESVYNAYEVGDIIQYNGVQYRVIKDSDTSKENVTLLKAEPLSVEEVNQYGAGHVNRYTVDSVGTAYDLNGYGGMAYYTSEACGYINDEYVQTDCRNDYASSEIKYVVDAWKTAKAPAASEARLISKGEYQEYCVEEEHQSTPSDTSTNYVPQYDWMSNNDYWYWTNTPYNDTSAGVWSVYDNGNLGSSDVSHLGSYRGTVRPVIVLPKSAL